MAKTECIFTEPVEGTNIAGLKILVENRYINKDERIVAYVTGNGLKVQDAVLDSLKYPLTINTALSEFKNLIKRLKNGKNKIFVSFKRHYKN